MNANDGDWMKKSIKRIAVALLLLLGLTVAYFCFWPVPVEPVSWEAPDAPGYAGVHARNTKLAELTVVDLNDHTGPEHIAIGDDGKIYTGVNGGGILRMEQDGTGVEIFAETDGRVLGIDFDAAGHLIVADAFRGLLSVDPSGHVAVLASEAEGKPIGFADAVIVASSGLIYFSDASQRYPPTDWNHHHETEHAANLDILEQSSTGRIIEYDPESGSTRVIARGLSFANGVALSSDEQSLFVAETGRYRIWRISVDASQVDFRQPDPEAQLILDNLPGFPDNLMRGRDGRIWVGLTAPRIAVLDDTSAKPFLRKLIARMPQALRPVPVAYGHVIAFSEDGEVVEDLQDPGGAFPTTTGVTETADRLYIHTLNSKGLAWLNR